MPLRCGVPGEPDLLSNPRLMAYLSRPVGARGPAVPKHFREHPNRQLKRSTIDLNYEDGRLYFPHTFRWGVTHEIVKSGTAFSAILKWRIWTPERHM